MSNSRARRAAATARGLTTVPEIKSAERAADGGYLRRPRNGVKLSEAFLVRFTATEGAAIRARARAEGAISYQECIRKIVRAALTTS